MDSNISLRLKVFISADSAPLAEKLFAFLQPQIMYRRRV